ncbi:MAG: PqqD family protein [Calditrichaeota bacterium]|nr:PqqD family protein [Calditrichota bacterium]
MAVNLLDLVPKRLLQFQENEDGNVTILKPKYRNKLMQKYVLPRMKKPHFKVNLDEYGSFVWKQIDGEKTVEEIGKQLKENFSEKIDPVYERLSVFIHSLVRYKFIEFKNYVPEKAEKSK